MLYLWCCTRLWLSSVVVAVVVYIYVVYYTPRSVYVVVANYMTDANFMSRIPFLLTQCYHDMDRGPLNYLNIPVRSTSGTFSTQILCLIIPHVP